MSNEVLIFTGDFDTHIPLPYAGGGIKAGFPSPAQDYIGDSLDFNKDIIHHPAATFYGRVKGDSMIDAGIDEGDIIVIDRSLEPQNGDIVVACIDGEFTIKYIDLSRQDEGLLVLKPANKHYQPIELRESDNFMIWGVVAWTIKQRAKLLE